jgi:hypothetical protein
MKIKFEIELEVDNSAVEYYNNNFVKFHTNLYNNKEKAEQALQENSYEQNIANNIEDLILNNNYDVINCDIKII